MFAGSIDTTKLVAARNKEALDTLGAKVVYDGTYNPVGETSWRPFIEAMRNAGVKGLYFVGDPGVLASFLTEAASVDMKFDWVAADPNNYDPAVLDAGAAADGVYMRTAFYPFLDPTLAKDNPATEQYRALMAQYKPDGKIAYLGVQGLSAWLLFAKAVGECGADVTPRLRLGEDAGDHRLDRRRTAGDARPADREGERLHGDPRGQGPEVPTRRRLRAQRRHLQL